jgi:hypothetical protein
MRVFNCACVFFNAGMLAIADAIANLLEKVSNPVPIQHGNLAHSIALLKIN